MRCVLVHSLIDPTIGISTMLGEPVRIAGFRDCVSWTSEPLEFLMYTIRKQFDDDYS